MYNVWENVLAEIQQKVSPGIFSTWFQDTSLISNDNGKIVVGVKNIFGAKQLSSKYLDIIKSSLEKNGVKVETINFETSPNKKPKIRNHEITADITSIKTTVRATKNKFDTNNNGLNNEFTLDNFVVYGHNEVAVAAARSIIDNPGKCNINPFFLYGGSGLGKTHLVQAIGNGILKKYPDYKVLYIPINHFYTEFIDSIQNNKGKEFYDKYKKLDCLIIDDFQQIIGKDKSQEEFFNIFNDLHMAKKQIIVTSDRLPSQIKTVDERLASRLTWAGAFDIQLPKFEEKCAILRVKAELSGAEIEEEAIEYIAEHVNTNIRDLEGKLSEILFMSDVRHITPLELIKSGSVMIENRNKIRQVPAKQILEKVAKQYNITVKDMCSKTRVSNIKTARQVAMFIMRKELSLSFPKIANEVGVKDHTTVMHGVEKIEEDIKLDFNLRDQVESIREKIYG